MLLVVGHKCQGDFHIKVKEPLKSNRISFCGCGLNSFLLASVPKNVPRITLTAFFLDFNILKSTLFNEGIT